MPVLLTVFIVANETEHALKHETMELENTVLNVSEYIPFSPHTHSENQVPESMNDFLLTGSMSTSGSNVAIFKGIR